MDGKTIFGRVYRRLGILLVLVLPVLGVLTACGAESGAQPPAATNAPGAPANGDKLKVVATYSILGDLVQNVAGDQIDLRVLVPAGGDAHTFEPSPADSVALAEAAVIFENGLEFETWLPDLFSASKSNAKRVVVSDGVKVLDMPEEDHDAHADEEHADEGEGHSEEEHADEEHAHGEHDPHIWHDVTNAVIMVEHIRDGLVAADATHAETYRANAETYIAQLKELDSFVTERIDTLPQERRKLVTTHDTFRYFARHYGLEIVGTALGSVSTEVADPSAAEIVALVEEIKATGVPAIFAENVSSGSLMERIAREAGVELAPTLYTDALGEPGSDGDTYEKMIRYNVATIVTALGK